MGESVGPAVAKKLISLLGKNGVAIQGVKYTASIASNVEMGSAGGPVMAQLAEQAVKQCPSTKIALGGYSQGAMVVHNAAKKLSGSSIHSAVVYGDPMNGEAIGSLSKSDYKSFCGMLTLHVQPSHFGN